MTRAARIRSTRLLPGHRDGADRDRQPAGAGETLAEANERSRFHLARDGDEALGFLHLAGEFAGAPRPGLILLDLNLPARHGLEILAQVKGDPDLRIIPVLVLSSSNNPVDIQASYTQQANAYIVKPADFKGLADMIRQIDACFPGLIRPGGSRRNIRRRLSRCHRAGGATG